MIRVPTPPQHHPSPTELDDLELIVTGAAAPVTGFNEPGSPLTLALPETLREAESVELVDPEGLPLARVTGGSQVEPLTHAQYGPFRRLYLSPAEVRDQYAGRTFVPVVDALTDRQLDDLRGRGPLVLLALAGTGTPELSATALVRVTLLAAAMLPAADVVVVPLASHGDAEVDHALGAQVVGVYADGDPIHGLVDGGELPDALAPIVAADRPAPAEQGLVLFFTGLSGSGKSTLARALMDRLLERGGRTVTSLDGDVVRRHLSAGLTFSKEDRETNIRRIGWVAAEIARHGGVAVCSPIAPFDETRQQVRSMVEDAGGAFFLVHVATPLEECERRDRKGLYAKARRGEIPEFTGISSPYEEPRDAAVRVDTTGRSIEDALDDVLVALRDAGYLDLMVELSPRPRWSSLSRPLLRRGLDKLDHRECAAEGPLRLHRQHLPLAVHGAGDPAAARRGLRDRGVQRGHARVHRPRDERGDDRRLRDRGRGLPQPPSDRRPGRRRPTWCSLPRPHTAPT